MEQILLYVGIAIVAAIVTVLLLLVTKVAIFVTLGCALVVGLIVITAARIELGFWDPLAPIAFVANATYAFLVSLVLLLVGRWQRWSLFLSKKGKDEA
jgi:hypothetical protein